MIKKSLIVTKNSNPLIYDVIWKNQQYFPKNFKK